MTDPLAGLLLAGFEGLTADAPSVDAVLGLGVGGLIVFGRNVQDPDQVARLLGGLRARGVRLLAVDQEGGRVARVRAPMTVWPPMGALGATGDPALARRVGAGLAEELGALGFNLDFAPVLDINSDPDNPVIGDRAFGADAESVLATALPLLDGIQSAGLAACAKHFPGHGHVKADSHYDLPVCTLDRAALDTHLAPFRAAIAAGVASIMTAHVVYPAVDAEQPATLSPAWIDGLLRGELGFEGPVLTDDLEMGAIVGRGGIGDAAVRAVKAGVDGLLICHRLDRMEEAVTALRREADADPSFAERCAQSLRRLATLSERFPGIPIDPSRAGIHRSLAQSISLGRVASSDPTAYLEHA